MTVTINASTSSGVVITPDYSGNIQLQYNGVAAPAFSATPSVVTSVTNTSFTKITFDQIDFDTANCYSTANSRFTPTIAGYYQIMGNITWASYPGGNSPIGIFKNGSWYTTGSSGGSAASQYQTVSGLIYMNGSTDYVEIYAYQNSGGTINTNTGAYRFCGYLVRGA